MSASVSISGLSSVKWDEFIEPSIQAFTKKVAEEALIDAVANGFDSEPTVVTDGVPNRDWNDVKPYGRIEWVRKQSSAEAARWIMAELVKKSPVLSGRYQRSHIYMINGAQAEDEDLDHLKPGDLVQIVNTMPYAAKIEGRDAFTRWDTKSTSHKGWKTTRRTVRKKQGASAASMQGESSQARNGVYRVVLGEAQARFGKTVFVDYQPAQLNLGVTVMGFDGGRRRRSVVPRQRIKRAQVYPCFSIKSKSLYS